MGLKRKLAKVANWQLEAEADQMGLLLLSNAFLTLSPLVVRTDKVLRTSRAMLCFFTV